ALAAICGPAAPCGPARARRGVPGCRPVLRARHHLCRHHLHRLHRAFHGPCTSRHRPQVCQLAGAHRMTAGRVRIAFDRVSVRFPTQDNGEISVGDEVSYEIHDRAFVSIIGPSSCGKATMMNIVAGFMQPSSGSVTLDGKPITGPGPDRGVIFQEYGVFPWLSVKENIAFGLNLRANRTSAAEREEICERYMRLMGLSE